MPLHISTPLLASRPLSRLSGCSVWLKLDALQPSGSFKIRGVGHLCEIRAAQGARGFISSSGGNAGIAAAYAGRRLGLPVTVFVPQTTTARARDLIAQEDAVVVVHGESWAEANALALSRLSDQTAFVHPFDDPLLWRGHASLIDEVVEAGLAFDAVVLSVGGGGLLCGVAEGLARHALAGVPIIAVETRGADSLAQAAAAGRRLALPAIDSVATSLGAKQVCDQAFSLTRTREVRCGVVDDRAALEACERFLDDQRVLVEPACGAALAAAYNPELGLLDGFANPLIVVCGGATADIDQIRAWRAARA